MKAYPIALLFPFLILFVSTTSLSQPAVYDKLYLHTDRDYYFLGDTIWFKSYYLDGQTHRLLPGIYNMHAELIDKKGEKIHLGRSIAVIGEILNQKGAVVST